MNRRTQFYLYATPPHDCSYLAQRKATTAFIDPHFPKDMELYENLSQHGFRRSGEHLYRPDCHGCHACIAVRVPVADFQPRRVQKRIWKRNQDLVIVPQAAVFKQEHFDLYCDYITLRHQGGGMDNPTPDNYIQFLSSQWSETVFYEFLLEKQLIAVAVVDKFEQALSAVYTFFSSEHEQRSLGVYAVLWQIELAKQLNLKWLYLGYWIEECQKMSYKTDYQPLEYYQYGVWQAF